MHLTTKEWCRVDGYELHADPYLPRHRFYVHNNKKVFFCDVLFPLLKRDGIHIDFEAIINGGAILEGRWTWIAWEYFKRL